MSVIGIATNNYTSGVIYHNFPFTMLAVEIHQSYPPPQFFTILYVWPCTTKLVWLQAASLTRMTYTTDLDSNLGQTQIWPGLIKVEACAEINILGMTS